MANKIAKKTTAQKVPKKKIKKIISASVSVHKTNKGLLVKISNPAGLKNFVEQLSEHRIAEEFLQLLESMKFWDWLKTQQKPDFSDYKIIWKKELYRVANELYRPFSIAGSISSGGRLNVGGAPVKLGPRLE